MLKTFANSYRLTAVSVGYRLAPENPIPAGIEDCADVAEYLIDNGPAEFNAPFRVIGSASAGGNFAALTTFHLMRTRPQHRLDAVSLINGLFDMTLNMPTTVQFKRAVPVDRESTEKSLDAYAPAASIEARRDPSMSPLYEDMHKLARESPFGTLPPTLITCGTADPLLDDSLLMSIKWMASGSEAVMKLYPGAPHMFSAFKGFKVADDTAAATRAFLNERLGG